MPSPLVWLDLISAKDAEIIYAFVLAGLEDNHCAQDNLSKEQWRQTEDLLVALTQKFDQI